MRTPLNIRFQNTSRGTGFRLAIPLSLLILVSLLTLVAAVASAAEPPAFTSLELSYSSDGTTWIPAAGSLDAGFVVPLCPAIDFHYLDVVNVATSPPLHDGSYGFLLNTTSVPDEFYAYWAKKGVEEGATGWQGDMWAIITGQEPIFYLKSEAGAFMLVDGLSLVHSIERHLRVNGDYPPGTYVYTGTIVDINGESSEITVAVKFVLDPPLFERLTLQQSSDKQSWSPVPGDLNSGFDLWLDPGEKYYYLNIDEADVNHDLASDLYGFFLDKTRLPHDFYEYWAGKGVKEGAADDWQVYMWDVINGLQPMFYLEADDGQYRLLDGLQDYLGETDVVRINGDYPAGHYYFSGTVQDECHVQSDVEAILNVVRQPLLDIAKTASASVVSPGDELVYTIVVANTGNADATGVTVTDTVPAHTEFEAADSNGAEVDGSVVWEGLTVPAGGTTTVVFTVTVDSPLPDGTRIVNQDYGVTCDEEVSKHGEQTITATVRLHYAYLPLVVRSFPPPPLCSDRVVNGGFENGKNAAPWEEWSSGGWGLIYRSSEQPVHGGGWGAWLGGYNDAHDELCQTIVIPENSTSATATWYWQVSTLDSSPSQVDVIVVEARSAAPAEILGQLSNQDRKQEWMLHTARIKATGKVSLCFVGKTDSSRITSFYVDDVALEVCVPAE